MKKIVASQLVPKAIGPYSQAVLFDSKYHMELSGQIGVNPKLGKLVEGGIEAEMEQVLANITNVLGEVGWTLKNVVKVRVYLVDMKDYGVVNEIYAKHFTEQFPARVALAVKQLPAGALIEIECTAVGDEITEK